MDEVSQTRPYNKWQMRVSAGFTLIELCIALVIIGLVIGGVLVGQDLIKSSQIRAQVKQIDEFKAAMNIFKLKYGYLPGDMPPAQAGQLGFFQFTGIWAGSTGYGEYGNNNGVIFPYFEVYPMWSHLSDAKLVKGQYGGVAGNLLRNLTFAPENYPAGYPAANYNGTADFYSKYAPKAKIGGSSVNVMYISSTNYLLTYFLRSGAYQLTDLTGGTPFTANEVFMFDKKTDDGLPLSGNVRNYDGDTYYDIYLEETVSHPCTSADGVDSYDLSPSTANDKHCHNIYIK